MKKILFAFLLSTFLGLTTSNLFCPKTSNSPRDIVIDTSFKITAEFSNINYSTIIVNNQVYSKNSKKVSITNNIMILIIAQLLLNFICQPKKIMNH